MNMIFVEIIVVLGENGSCIKRVTTSFLLDELE